MCDSEMMRLPRPDKPGFAMTLVVMSDSERDGVKGGKRSPEGFPSGGGLGVSPSLIKSPPRLGD